MRESELLQQTRMTKRVESIPAMVYHQISGKQPDISSTQLYKVNTSKLREFLKFCSVNLCIFWGPH